MYDACTEAVAEKKEVRVETKVRPGHADYEDFTRYLTRVVSHRTTISEGTGLFEDGFEWLIVDCPPRMDTWGWAGLELCAEVLLPVQSEFFAMHGLTQMMRTLEDAQRQFPGRSRLLGVLPTLVDTREAIAVDVLSDLRENLRSELLTTVIFRDAGFVEAASHGQTLFEYKLESKGARAYGELVWEILYGRAQ